MSSNKYSLAVLGSGSYGTALAISVARKGLPVVLWGFDPQEVKELEENRENKRFMPGYKLPDSLDVTNDLSLAVSSAEVLLVVVPSMFFGSTLKSVKPYLNANHRLIWATKGLEKDTGRLLLFPELSAAVPDSLYTNSFRASMDRLIQGAASVACPRPSRGRGVTTAFSRAKCTFLHHCFSRAFVFSCAFYAETRVRYQDEMPALHERLKY